MTIRRLLPMALAAGLTITGCGSDGGSSGAVSATTAPVAATSPSATTAPPAPSDSATVKVTTVKVATDPNLGEYLVGPSGLTLYLFEKDEGTTTACTGACADNWPPLVASGTPTVGDGVDAGQLATADGIVPNQVAYHGHLLYYFIGDQAPGDTNGVGIPAWYPVSPAGTAIPDDADDDGGYGY